MLQELVRDGPVCAFSVLILLITALCGNLSFHCLSYLSFIVFNSGPFHVQLSHSKDQAIWFLNGYWNEHQQASEDVWNYVHKVIATTRHILPLHEFVTPLLAGACIVPIPRFRERKGGIWLG